MDKIKSSNGRKLSARQRNSSPAARQAVDAALKRYAISALRRPLKDAGSLEANEAVARYLAEELSEPGRTEDRFFPVGAEALPHKPADKARLSNPADLGRRIRTARKRLGATQQDLADLSGLSLGSIKALEGGGNVGIQSIFTVLAVVGIELYGD